MRVSIATGCGLLLLACTTAPPVKPAEPVRPEPVATPSVAAPSASADAGKGGALPMPDTHGWVKDWPKTWTDSRVVDALAARCDFEPNAHPFRESDDSSPPDLLRCALGYVQTCSPDVCANTTDACEKGCMTSCRDCGSTCTSTCSSCKASCTDAACVRRCAQQTADCRQTCNTTLDRCATADCNKAHAECGKRMRASFKAHGCAAKCTAFERCRDSCDSSKKPQTPEATAACHTRCEDTLSPTYNPCMAKCGPLDGTDPKAEACMAACQEAPCTPMVCMLRDQVAK